MEFLNLIIFFIFLIVLYYSFTNLHKTILVIVPISILFQPYCCIRFDSPAISLLFSIHVSIIMLYSLKNRLFHVWNRFPLKTAFNLIVLVYIIGLIVSPLPTISILPMCFSVLLSYLMVVIYFNEIKNPLDINLSTKAFFSAIILLLLYFLYEFINQSNPFVRFLWNILPIEKEWIYFSEETRFGGIRCQSIMSICISWGALCCISLWGLIYCNWNKHRPLLKSSLFLLLLLGVISSGSRSAYMFLVVIMLGLIISYKGKYKYIIRTITCITIILSMGFIINSVDVLFDEDMSGSNFTQRQSQFLAVYDILVNSPIWGFGIKGLEVVKKNIGAEVLGAESVWLQQLIYFGLLGVIQQIVLYVSCYKYIKKYRPLTYLLFGWILFSTMSTSPGLYETYFLSILLLFYKTKTFVYDE